MRVPALIPATLSATLIMAPIPCKVSGSVQSKITVPVAIASGVVASTGAVEVSTVPTENDLVKNADESPGEANPALRRAIISRLGDESRDQDDDDDGWVPVRWEPGVGFVRTG